MAKKAKPANFIELDGKKYRWCAILTMVAHDLGLLGSEKTAGELAMMVCEKRAWPHTTKRGILTRRAAELLAAGFSIPKSNAGQGKWTPKAPKQPKRGTRYAPAGFALGAPHPEYKRDEAFYKSTAWRQIRLLALDNCRCCQACGARPPDVVLHVDHVIPRYKAPHLALTLSNLQILCEDCNVGKGAWSQADFRDHFRSI